MRDADGRRLRAGDAAAGQQQIERALRADQFRQQAGGGRREHTELHFRLAEIGVAGDEHEMAGEREFQPAAEALAAHRHQQRHRRLDHAQDQAMQPRQHRGALRRQMLLDAGAEAEMRPFGIDQHRAELAVAEMLGQRLVERADHRGIDQIGLRTVEPQPQQRAVRLVPDLERLVTAMTSPAA